MTIGTSFLRASELAQFGARTLHTRMMQHPLLALFPREEYGSDKIKIRVDVGRTRVAKLHGWDEPVRPSKGTVLRELEFTPGLIKEGRELSNEEISFFRGWDELVEQQQPTDALMARRAKHLSKITRDAMQPVQEKRHVMCSQALRNALVAEIDGITDSIDLGITQGSNAAVPWTTFATAKPSRDIFKWKQEFLDQADVPADTVIFNEALFTNYLHENADWLSYIKENPTLAAAFAGFESGNLRFVQPGAPIFMFGMTWIPVGGKYENEAGTKVNRWPVEFLTFLSLRAPDGEQTLEWASARNRYNPNARPAFRVWDQPNPIATIAEYSDNGIPVPRIQERVMYVDVTAT